MNEASLNLTGKNAFVTGGGRGIGRAIALRLARAGCRVAFSFRADREAAEETRRLLVEGGGQALCLQADVRERAAVKAALRDAVDRFGPLDALVNNAGVNKPADFDRIDDEDWDWVMAVNLKGPFICAQEALPLMRDGGAIVNIGSVSGQYGGPRTAHYAASKAGLISLGQVIARFAAARGIRCNTVAAGLIQSAMAAQGLADPAVRKAAESTLLDRLGAPDEVADTVAFLISDQASYITAQTINVNGGLYF